VPHTPVTLLTGFLGAGKTSLLARWLEHPAFRDTAVIVNEFGEIALDHLIVADLAPHVVELRNGCLCCTIRGDLALSLRRLHEQRALGAIPRFARVVVETSGLAAPIPLVHTLIGNLPLARAFRLRSLICVVDALHGAATLNAHATARDQLALADLAIMSKMDIASAAQIDAMRKVIASYNPDARVIGSSRESNEAAQVLDRYTFHPERTAAAITQWLAAPHSQTNHGHDYVQHVITHDGELSLAGTTVFLNHLVNQQREQVLRIKALARFRERPGQAAVLHAVQNKFYPVDWLTQWPDGDPRCRFVFIGRGLDRGLIDESFRALCV
jgi:G3E family GTPase